MANEEHLAILKQGVEASMKGRSAFTATEAHEIRRLLHQKCQAPRDEQRRFRDRLRDLGFYISDHTDSTAGFTASNFDVLVASGRVTILD
jgi:hypothetical protein